MKCFEKEETFETPKEIFLLPLLGFRDFFFFLLLLLQFLKFRNQIFGNFLIKFYIKICLMIITIFLLSSNKKRKKKQKKTEQENLIT